MFREKWNPKLNVTFHLDLALTSIKRFLKLLFVSINVSLYFPAPTSFTSTFLFRFLLYSWHKQNILFDFLNLDSEKRILALCNPGTERAGRAGRDCNKSHFQKYFCTYQVNFAQLIEQINVFLVFISKSLKKLTTLHKMEIIQTVLEFLNYF